MKVLREKSELLNRMTKGQRVSWLFTYLPSVLTFVFILYMTYVSICLAPIMNGDEVVSGTMTLSQLSAYVSFMWMAMMSAFLVWVSKKIFGGKEDRERLEGSL